MVEGWKFLIRLEMGRSKFKFTLREPQKKKMLKNGQN
jgi:hypothetical protein